MDSEEKKRKRSFARRMRERELVGIRGEQKSLELGRFNERELERNALKEMI